MTGFVVGLAIASEAFEPLHCPENELVNPDANWLVTCRHSLAAVELATACAPAADPPIAAHARAVPSPVAAADPLTCLQRPALLYSECSVGLGLLRCTALDEYYDRPVV